jgi:4-hydroxy-3-polyprenylbenzoate decarboxylase
LATKRIVVGMSGASGAAYGVRILEKPARRASKPIWSSRVRPKDLHHETGLLLKDLKVAYEYHAIEEVGADRQRIVPD